MQLPFILYIHHILFFVYNFVYNNIIICVQFCTHVHRDLTTMNKSVFGGNSKNVVIDFGNMWRCGCS